MGADAAMLRSRLRGGHCRVPGHGSWCEVSDERRTRERGDEIRALTAEVNAEHELPGPRLSDLIDVDRARARDNALQRPALWVDDERPAPEGWRRASTLSEAQEMLRRRVWHTVSLDHDLGDGQDTRGIVRDWCEGQVPWPHIVLVHSQNPVGRKWLEGTIARYKP